MVDLCHGPHLPNTDYLKTQAVNNLSRAFWRADVNKDPLQVSPLHSSTPASLPCLHSHLHLAPMVRTLLRTLLQCSDGQVAQGPLATYCLFAAAMTVAVPTDCMLFCSVLVKCMSQQSVDAATWNTFQIL